MEPPATWGHWQDIWRGAASVRIRPVSAANTVTCPRHDNAPKDTLMMAGCGNETSPNLFNGCSGVIQVSRCFFTAKAWDRSLQCAC